MYGRLTEYLKDVAEALDDANLETAADITNLLSLRDIHAESSCLLIEEPDVTLLRRAVPSPFDALTAQHLRTLYFIGNHKYEDAYSTQSQMVTIFAKEILQKRKDENWFLPICYRFCSDLRLCAKAADLKPSRPRALEDSSYHEKSAHGIMECYRSCVSDL